MKLSIDFWEVVSFLLSFTGLMFACGKLLLSQILKQLNERFEALEVARRETEIGWTRLEREFLEFRADLPLHYVRREDYLRGQAIIEAKLDAVYSKIELIQHGNY
ncbi:MULTISPECIES: hypothetical protein [Enterobacter cloacae complex]|uniref:hypothetical protein n=1 Tax=Enterobacter cloacae complex TaxID=354276 RepID=UPI000795CC21|nr:MULTISPECIES: hypothetical protein [Enterobacter cloacae complex]MCU3017656.1 hypothetical protein [Enterobacter hormaechei subsp. oharae]HBC0022673.1 hypothetical protein [Enterobacter hormaechei subsp. steigerwaltii]MBE4882897.1 hypothetical protein [Enterobacter cloacae complex sp. P39RS]MCM7698358.1 hypothetical protein [Enterobacter hormaechei]MCU3614267.1 hypothetical protein [Enterobacter hormaechei subsp. oharae]